MHDFQRIGTTEDGRLLMSVDPGAWDTLMASLERIESLVALLPLRDRIRAPKREPRNAAPAAQGGKEPRLCRVCGKRFVPVRRGQSCCTSACRSKYHPAKRARKAAAPQDPQDPKAARLATLRRMVAKPQEPDPIDQAARKAAQVAAEDAGA